MFNGKKNGGCHTTGCLVTHIVVAALLFLATVVALASLYATHILPDGTGGTRLAFETGNGSLSVIAFVVSLLAFLKSMKACMIAGDCCCKK